MNLENNIDKIIVYSLSLAFVCSQMLVPFIKTLLIGVLERKYDKLKSSVPKDDKWGNIVGMYNSELSNKMSRMVNMNFKPLSCMKCMTFWFSISISLMAGIYEEAGLVGVVGLASGMIAEGIIMRYL